MYCLLLSPDYQSTFCLPFILFYIFFSLLCVSCVSHLFQNISLRRGNSGTAIFSGYFNRTCTSLYIHNVHRCYHRDKWPNKYTKLNEHFSRNHIDLNDYGILISKFFFFCLVPSKLLYKHRHNTHAPHKHRHTQEYLQ